jgi:hypothetical protein
MKERNMYLRTQEEVDAVAEQEKDKQRDYIEIARYIKQEKRRVFRNGFEFIYRWWFKHDFYKARKQR